MEQFVERVLITLNEMSIGNIGRKPSSLFEINKSNLRIRSLILEDREEMLKEALDMLKSKNHISNVNFSDNKFVSLKFMSNQETNQDIIERVSDLSLRRAILFTLYEEYRVKHHRMKSLVKITTLAPLLQVREDEIIRNSDFLRNKNLIEIPFGDSEYTCLLTDEGLSMCDDLDKLMVNFSRINLNQEESLSESPVEENHDPAKKRKVFVVHGRNILARDAMYAFLNSLDLSPIEWGEAVSATGEGTPYIRKVVEKAFEIAQAVVVILSPDQISYLRDSYAGADGSEERLSILPRPNVILEAGLSMGLMPDRTILVDIGEIGEISDLGGLHRVRLDDSAEKRQSLLDRLRRAGCAVDIEGKIQWQTSGNFEAARPSKINYEEIKNELIKSLNISGSESDETQYETPKDENLSIEFKKILMSLSEAGDVNLTPDNIAQILEIHKTKAKHYLNELKDLELINNLSTVGAPSKYFLTKKGISYVVENNLI